MTGEEQKEGKKKKTSEGKKSDDKEAVLAQKKFWMHS